MFIEKYWTFHSEILKKIFLKYIFNTTYLKFCQLSCARHYFVVGVNNFDFNSKNKKRNLFIAVLINNMIEQLRIYIFQSHNGIPINSTL